MVEKIKRGGCDNMMKRLKVSVIIPTRNRQKVIIECIESISMQSIMPNEVIIVDASDDQSLSRELRQVDLAPADLVYLHTEPSTNYQRNIGVQKATGDVIIFLDDDVVLEEDFINEIIKVFEQDEKKEIGGVMGTITNINPQSPRRILSRSLNFFFFLSMISSNGRIRLSGFPAFCIGKLADGLKDVQVLSGCEMAYRREVFEHFHFDEKLTGYCYMDDVDFSYRASGRYRLVFTPFARVQHNQPSEAKDLRLRKKMLICNHVYLFRKNMPQTVKNKVAFYISLLGIIVAALAKRNVSALRGVAEGLVEVFLRGNPSFPPSS